MILPDKHIFLAESLLGFGAILISLLKTSMHVDDLWLKFTTFSDQSGYPAYQSFDNFLLTLDLLYMIGLLELENDGKVRRAAT
jgi:hypothetical protein